MQLISKCMMNSFVVWIVDLMYDELLCYIILSVDFDIAMKLDTRAKINSRRRV